MKKVLIGLLSTILGAFGIIAVDKTIEGRVAKLEAEVSSLHALHTTAATSAWETYPTTTTATTTSHETYTTYTMPTTTTYTMLTTNLFDWNYHYNERPYFIFIDNNQVRLKITEEKYQLKSITPKSNDPQTPEENRDKYLWQIVAEGEAPVSRAGEKLYYQYYSYYSSLYTSFTSGFTTVNNDGSFVISYECATDANWCINGFPQKISFNDPNVWLPGLN